MVGMYEISLLEQSIDTSPNASANFSESDMRFFKHLRKIYKYIAVIDKLKSDEIRYSECFEPLSNFIKDKTDWENKSNGMSMTTLTSNFSQMTLLKS